MSTVTIGCRLASGLILESGYTIANGAVARLRTYTRVMLAGANQSTLQLAAQNPGQTLVSGKHMRAGITENVDEAFFDKWVEDHRESHIVKNGLIFKMKNRREAEARGKDEEQKKTGFEPLNIVDGKVEERKGSGFGGFTAPNASPLTVRTEEA